MILFTAVWHDVCRFSQVFVRSSKHRTLKFSVRFCLGLRRLIFELGAVVSCSVYLKWPSPCCPFLWNRAEETIFFLGLGP